jgi:predicted RND superfamily exporter protein
MKNNLIFQIGLTLIPGIGPITAKNLLVIVAVLKLFSKKKKNC